MRVISSKLQKKKLEKIVKFPKNDSRFGDKFFFEDFSIFSCFFLLGAFTVGVLLLGQRT